MRKSAARGAEAEEESRVREAFRPVLKQSLSDRLARRIRNLIRSGNYQQGDRLPAITEMARRFGVGHPSVREALKKLETMGVVEIRHGAGVFVSRSHEVLVMASPDYAGTVTRKLLLDLIQTRMPLEIESITCAARHATPEHLARMRELLTVAAEHLHDDDELLNVAAMGFHRQIALASDNAVLAQVIDVLQALFTDEQRVILDIGGSREEDHREHMGLVQALEARDEAVCARLMREHLERVRQAVIHWNPVEHPIEGAAR
jgi:GntR family transcriptional regulator, transcriptional repressor for pyruvate dehydrogenase complex